MTVYLIFFALHISTNLCNALPLKYIWLSRPCLNGAIPKYEQIIVNQQHLSQKKWTFFVINTQFFETD